MLGPLSPAEADPAAQDLNRKQRRGGAVVEAAQGKESQNLADRLPRGPQRGSNAQSIGDVLQAAAPRAMRPAEIRKALLDKGIKIAFTSIRHALGQLEARNASEQVGNTRSWRHRGGGS